MQNKRLQAQLGHECTPGWGRYIVSGPAGWDFRFSWLHDSTHAASAELMHVYKDARQKHDYVVVYKLRMDDWIYLLISILISAVVQFDMYVSGPSLTYSHELCACMHALLFDQWFHLIHQLCIHLSVINENHPQEDFRTEMKVTCCRGKASSNQLSPTYYVFDTDFCFFCGTASVATPCMRYVKNTRTHRRYYWLRGINHKNCARISERD